MALDDIGASILSVSIVNRKGTQRQLLTTDYTDKTDYTDCVFQIWDPCDPCDPFYPCSPWRVRLTAARGGLLFR